MSSNIQSISKASESKNDSSPDRFVGLEEMRTLNDEFNEMIKKFKQKEALNSINTTLNEKVETPMELQEVVKELRRELQLNQQRVDVASNSNEPMSQTDIRRQINGKWRRLDNHDRYFSLKFESDTVMFKWNGWNSYVEFPIGVEHPENGLTTSVENNRIVQRNLTNQGKERIRDEFFIEKERLQRAYHFHGTVCKRYTYERYADPDP